MILVDDILPELFPEQPVWGTKVWMSDLALEELVDYVESKDKPKKGQLHGRFMKKLKKMAISGFDGFIGEKSPIRPELGIYRVGDSGKFRLYGFFTDATHKEFIALDAFENSKAGNSRLKPREIERIEKNVLSVKNSGKWAKNITEN